MSEVGGKVIAGLGEALAYQKGRTSMAVELARLREENEQLKEMAAQAYQVIGNCLHRLGDDAFDSDEGQRALNYFADFGEGHAFDPEFLPWPRAALGDGEG